MRGRGLICISMDIAYLHIHEGRDLICISMNIKKGAAYRCILMKGDMTRRFIVSIEHDVTKQWRSRLDLSTFLQCCAIHRIVDPGLMYYFGGKLFI